MSLADDLQALAQSSAGCATCSWYRDRTPEEQASFDAYLELIREKRGRYVDLYAVCQKHGLQIAEKTFRDHCHRHVS